MTEMTEQENATGKFLIVFVLVTFLVLILTLIVQITFGEVTKVFPSGDTTHVVWGTRIGFFQGRVYTYNATPWLFSKPTEFLTTPDGVEYRIEGNDGSIWQRMPWFVDDVRTGYKVDELRELPHEIQKLFDYGRKTTKTPPC